MGMADEAAPMPILVFPYAVMTDTVFICHSERDRRSSGGSRFQQERPACDVPPVPGWLAAGAHRVRRPTPGC